MIQCESVQTSLHNTVISDRKAGGSNNCIQTPLSAVVRVSLCSVCTCKPHTGNQGATEITALPEHKLPCHCHQRVSTAALWSQSLQPHTCTRTHFQTPRLEEARGSMHPTLGLSPQQLKNQSNRRGKISNKRLKNQKRMDEFRHLGLDENLVWSSYLKK